MPLVGPPLSRELGRRGFAGIPPERVSNAAVLPEITHVATRRLLGKRWPALWSGLMYRVKAQFDAAVSRRLGKEHATALVGMYAASLESFRAVRRRDGLAVLNFVNSHPVEHNRCLAEMAGLKPAHHEMIPEWVVRRVESELEIADLVLAPSRFVADQLARHGVERSRITIIPYGVDLSSFRPYDRGEGRNEEELICLYVGQISHRKGIRTLLSAARMCRDLPVEFRLVGPMVNPEVLDGVPENVRYDGVSLPVGVAEAMRRADMFVLPTLAEGCALVVLEAMATGLPVITTTNAGSSEVIDSGKDGVIVPPGDAKALADAIRMLAEQPDLRQSLGVAARQKVEHAYSWESYGEKVLVAISDLSLKVG